MFFSFSKIFWLLASPLNLVFLLIFGGGVLSLFFNKVGRALMILGMVLFAVIGFMPLGHNLMVVLERQYERPKEMPDRLAGIIVLGGSFVADVGGARNIPALNENAERVLDGLTLADHYKDALLVFSGGNGRLINNNRSETADVELFLKNLGYPMDRVILEGESRNTYENLKESRKLLLPQPDEKWLLVTSAYHMPRSAGVARMLMWPTMQAWPTDYRTNGKFKWTPDFDFLGNFYDFHVAMHEILGLIAYKYTGKTLPKSSYLF